MSKRVDPARGLVRRIFLEGGMPLMVRVSDTRWERASNIDPAILRKAIRYAVARSRKRRKGK